MAYKINSGTGLLPARITGKEGQVERDCKSPGTAKRPMQRQEEPAWLTCKPFFGQQEPPPHWDIPQWQSSPGGGCLADDHQSQHNGTEKRQCLEERMSHIFT
jgi:hypothetical protein